MSPDKRYWIWLQLSLGCGAYFKDIIKDFGSVENLYNAYYGVENEHRSRCTAG